MSQASNPLSQQANIPVCLITGGSSGIGLATAKRFANQGYHIAICGRDAAKLTSAKSAIESKLVENAKCLTIAGDLNHCEDANRVGQAALDAFGSVDVLVNNAALAPLENFESISQDSFESITNVNIKSVFYLTQLIWKQMLQHGGGQVVNISSMAAVDPFPGFSLYGASKAWIELLTSALAAEGKPHGIRVCAVRPGAVETPLLRGLFPDFPADQCVTPEAIADQVWRCVSAPETHPSGTSFEVTRQP